MSSSVRPLHMNQITPVVHTPCSAPLSISSLFINIPMPDQNKSVPASKNGLRISKRGLAHRIGESTDTQPAKVRKSSFQMPITKYLLHQDREPGQDGEQEEDCDDDDDVKEIDSMASSPSLSSVSRLKFHTMVADPRPSNQKQHSGHARSLREKKSTPPAEVASLELESHDSSSVAGNDLDPKPPKGRRQSARLSQIQHLTGGDKKNLRSQHGNSSRKSILSKYFANYYEIMAGPECLTAIDYGETVVEIVDIHVEDGQESSRDQPNPESLPQSAVSSRPDRHPLQLAEFPSITVPTQSADPLSDEFYLKAHKQAERREKHLRNIEKEHVQHEKNQLLQLLADLQGPRWQQVMGVSSSADMNHKEWETKRDYFVTQVEELVSKFKLWKEEEKILKQRRAQSQNGVEADLLFPPPPTPPPVISDPEPELSGNEENQSDHMDVDDRSVHPTSPPVEGLRLSSRSIRVSSSNSPALQPNLQASLPPTTYSLPSQPVASFPDPHSRDLALCSAGSKHNVWAFGAPVPDVAECEFEPPADLITIENLRAHARRRRRLRREARPTPR